MLSSPPATPPGRPPVGPAHCDREDAPANGLDLRAAIVAIASHGLVGAAIDPPGGPLPDVSWGRLLHGVRCHGLEAHLIEVISHGHLRVRDAQHEQARRAHVEATARALVLQEELLRCVDLLREAGIDYRVLKGLALAHLVYPKPVLRSHAASIDLLVRSHDLDAAVATLTRNGAERARPLRYGFNRRFGKAVRLRLPSGVHVYLHRTLAPGPFGKRVESAELFETRSVFEAGDRTLLSLGLEELLIESCYTAVLSDDPLRLVALRDVAELCLSGGLDATRVETLAARWGSIAALSRGIALAWETFRLADVVPLSVRANRFVPTRREQRLLGAYEPRTVRVLAATKVERGRPAESRRRTRRFPLGGES